MPDARAVTGLQDLDARTSAAFLGDRTASFAWHEDPREIQSLNRRVRPQGIAAITVTPPTG
jgi:hypothetical protein